MQAELGFCFPSGHDTFSVPTGHLFPVFGAERKRYLSCNSYVPTQRCIKFSSGKFVGTHVRRVALTAAAWAHRHFASDDDELMLNVLRCQLTYQGQVVTNAEARFNNSLRPRKPEGSLGRTAQDGHLDSHTAPEL